MEQDNQNMTSPAMHFYAAGARSTIGRRASQQDRLRIAEIWPGEVLAMVCDGMGGMENGEKASMTAAQSLERQYKAARPDSVPQFFYRAASQMDADIVEMSENGDRSMRTGTTVVAALLRGDSLYYLSVGDSRIYLYRGGKLMQLTIDHNYRMELDSKRKSGEISEEEYHAREHKAEALVSYLGMNGLRYISINKTPIQMLRGDRILLCSEGIYKYMSHEEMTQIFRDQAGSDPGETADALLKGAAGGAVRGGKLQDNTTAIVLDYRPDGMAASDQDNTLTTDTHVCPACGSEFSTMVTVCPFCGHNLEEKSGTEYPGGGGNAGAANADTGAANGSTGPAVLNAAAFNTAAGGANINANGNTNGTPAGRRTARRKGRKGSLPADQDSGFTSRLNGRTILLFFMVLFLFLLAAVIKVSGLLDFPPQAGNEAMTETGTEVSRETASAAESTAETQTKAHIKTSAAVQSEPAAETAAETTAETETATAASAESRTRQQTAAETRKSTGSKVKTATASNGKA